MVWERCRGDALDLSALSNLHWQCLPSIAAAVFSLFFVITCAGMRMQAVYRDAPLASLNTQIHLGPAKGIYTTSASCDKYEGIVKFLMDEGEDRSAAFSELLPFGYLCLRESPASPTVWRLPLPSEDMEKYLEAHPEKRPDILLVLKQGYGYGNGGGEFTLKDVEALIKGAVISKGIFVCICLL